MGKQEKKRNMVWKRYQKKCGHITTNCENCKSEISVGESYMHYTGSVKIGFEFLCVPCHQEVNWEPSSAIDKEYRSMIFGMLDQDD